jgi:hypothetical protein
MKTLKIQSLDKRWHDRDEILLHAAFQVLIDFMENERPDKTIDWSADDMHKHAWKEMRSLYKWWTQKRPARRSPLDNKRLAIPPLKFEKIPATDRYRTIEPNRKRYAGYYTALREHSRLEQKWLDEDQGNLHRLIDIRGFLWT